VMLMTSESVGRLRNSIFWREKIARSSASVKFKFTEETQCSDCPTCAPVFCMFSTYCGTLPVSLCVHKKMLTKKCVSGQPSSAFRQHIRRRHLCSGSPLFAALTLLRGYEARHTRVASVLMRDDVSKTCHDEVSEGGR
jgi:hypothetical protein